MTLTSHQLCAAVPSVAGLPAQRADAGVVVVENTWRESLRAAHMDLAEVSACVWAKWVCGPWQRTPLYARRIVLQQRVEALRWPCTEELDAQCNAIEHDATEAWAHRPSVFSAVAALP